MKTYEKLEDRYDTKKHGGWLPPMAHSFTTAENYDRLNEKDRQLEQLCEVINRHKKVIDFHEKRRRLDDTFISSNLSKISEIQSQNKKLQETVDTLAAQVQELQLATSSRCKICDIKFIPSKHYHDKCKTCNLAKKTISCKKCKKLFSQRHHTHKHCDTCFT